MFKWKDGEVFTAADERQLVERMHASSRAPCDSDLAWMRDCARRAKVAYGVDIRCDTPENFIADLLEIGAVETISIN